jgi:hypothetical protein
LPIFVLCASSDALATPISTKETSVLEMFCISICRSRDNYDFLNKEARVCVFEWQVLINAETGQVKSLLKALVW